MNVPQGESDSGAGSTGVTGLVFVRQTAGATFGGRDVGRPDSELWTSDNGTINRIASDSRYVYDWVEIFPGKERVPIG